jgi:ribosome-associated translation inhibitor RaiA
MTDRLRIELDTKHFELSAGEISAVEKELEPLHAHAVDFPVSDLNIVIAYHERTQSYYVNLALMLPGRTLAATRTAENLLSAVDACVEKMIRRLLQYKAELGDTSDRNKYRKGTRHEVLATTPPAGDEIREAVAAGDYVAFRQATYPYEETLRERIGRWIERYPALANELDDRWALADFVEEVFLAAFEEFDKRPEQVRFGQWLENLIPQAIEAIARDPDEQLANIEFVRTAQDAEER